jgi:hypothetical protein
MTVLLGYQHIGSADPCPFCGGKTYTIRDVGDPEKYRVDCWCGASARVDRNDPDLVELLGGHQ